jgi:sugar transferase (PEP-CTERM/EpsH1 system associated)
MTRPALVAHIVVRFDYGGLENGVVNVVNGLSGGEFRHAVIALTESTDFSSRLRDGVPVYALGKRGGKDPGAYLRLFRLLRKLRPTVVHTRNVGTLDCAFIAWLAGVPIRIHGEHGWDVFDPDGATRKYRFLRRAMSPFVASFVAVSRELRDWLVASVRVPGTKVARICNGVDTDRFRPRETDEPSPLPTEIFGGEHVVVGSVTRFTRIKDPLNLIDAFLRLRRDPALTGRSLRLVMIGDGELRAEAVARLEQAGALSEAWLPGSRDDVAALLRAMDIFVLGSKREGISNTVLEAMASGLPVIATATGGNDELILAGETGQLVPAENSVALAEAIAKYVSDADLRRNHGRHARGRALSDFSLSVMIGNYRRLYETTICPVDA